MCVYNERVGIIPVIKADASFAGGPDCDISSRIEKIGYVIETLYEWDADDCCRGAAGVELAYNARNILQAEHAYIAQKASTTATFTFFFLSICSLCTMNTGTIVNVQTLAQDNAE
jgi:hypothetical protein